jgi:hypothetical protein
MATKIEAMEVYSKELTKLGVNPIDSALLEKIILSLGLAAYDMNSDSALVSANDKDEKMLIVDRLLVKKFGMVSDLKLVEHIDKAIEKYGKSNPKKYRTVLYYLITKDLKMEKVYLGN